MDLARARTIVEAICDRSWATMGVADMARTLDGLSLAEMLQAKTMVENSNTASAAVARLSGERHTIYVVPDDRLIAAAYALQHYAPSRKPALQIPDGDHHVLCLAVVRLPIDTDTEEARDHRAAVCS